MVIRRNEAKPCLCLAALVVFLAALAGCRGTIFLDDERADAADGAAGDGADVVDAGDHSDPGPGDDGSIPSDEGGGPADPGPCPATLAGRLSSVTLSVAPDQVNTAAGGYFSACTPPILAPRQGGAWLAWQDTGGRVHVTPLDTADGRAGSDVTVEGNELRGLAAHTGGFAVMVQRGADQMAVVGFDSGGNKTFDTMIIGNNNHDQQGDKWVKREWGDNGRLAFFGDRYAVYFGHTMNWGAQGEHQGDLLWFYDLSGNRSGGSWDWGCSHSLDVRLGYNGTLLGPVCLSDCYPTKAIWFNHQGAEIHPEPSGNCSGYSDA